MNRFVACVSGAACLVVPWNAAVGGVIYVDADAAGKGDGTNWADAFTSVQSAISAAKSGDEIWVAKGTYSPIKLATGVRVYGGFTGSETKVMQSNPEEHVTYLSGGGSSQAVISINNDETTLLFGFHIVDGRAKGWDERGGGVYLEKSSPRIVRCTFTRNVAYWAGAAVASYHEGAPTFVNCRFYKNGKVNEDTAIAGGAVFIRSGSPRFVNCLFADNTAQEGGAVVNITGGPSFVNCTFANNEAVAGKGGAVFDDSGLASIKNSIVWGNRAQLDGTQELHNNRDVGTTAILHSDVKGSWPGTGNVDADPLFVDAAAGDYRLKAGSPCSQGGDAEALDKDSVDVDLDGNTTEDLRYDLGMSEDAGTSTIPIGAYSAVKP